MDCCCWNYVVVDDFVMRGKRSITHQLIAQLGENDRHNQMDPLSNSTGSNTHCYHAGCSESTASSVIDGVRAIMRVFGAKITRTFPA